MGKLKNQAYLQRLFSNSISALYKSVGKYLYRVFLQNLV